VQKPHKNVMPIMYPQLGLAYIIKLSASLGGATFGPFNGYRSSLELSKIGSSELSPVLFNGIYSSAKVLYVVIKLFYIKIYIINKKNCHPIPFFFIILFKL
jgi:hypothetical protein